MKIRINHKASIADRVRDGGTHLDLSVPGWWTSAKVKLTDLDMECCDNCVLGMLFGSYEVGQAELFGGTNLAYDRKAAQFGFTLFEEDGDCWSALTSAWKLEIRKRRVEVPTPRKRKVRV